MYGSFMRRIAAGAVAAAMLMTTSGVCAEEQRSISLMCLGDSITDGFWMTGGYRNTLCNLIAENGQQALVDMVGPNWGGSGYDPQHAGYSGYSVDNIAQEDSISGGRVGISSFIDWLLKEHPADVIFLQIGTNDILSLYDLAHYGERLEGLVDVILPTLPEDGALYLATLPCMDAGDPTYINPYYFTVESMDAAVDQCNAQIRALVEKKRNEGANIVLADMNRVLKKSDLYDGVHPSEEGYQKMGQFWYQQLLSYWNGETDPPQTTPSETTTTTEPQPIPLVGDIDGNGSVEMADAVMLTKHLILEAPLLPEQADRADLHTDGTIDAKDLTVWKRNQLS
ncbi:MAG: hypothetical protein IKM30_08465 [Oscillospiraceae bacterium]|nr:hypothetical protein [Oscillospiraceae bacterium]